MDEALKQLLTLGRGYFEKKQYAQAEKYLTQVVEQSQSFADVYNMLGVLYHDQGQSATKLKGFNRGVTLCAGLETVFTTPAHGTAFDIVGQGRATTGALEQAVRLGARLAAARRERKAA